MKTEYILITPAKNEEAYIEKSILSLISQTILPNKWIIVDDGSTDKTGEIVNSYCAHHDFIKLLTVDSPKKRNFSSKVRAFNTAYGLIKNLNYDFIGNLDADVSFEQDYYEKLFRRFEENPKLGIAGGILFENYKGKFMPAFVSPSTSVFGPIQLFRRECFEEVEGYEEIDIGGIDIFAEIKARMLGWQVKTCPQIKVYHHRLTGTQGRNILSYRFHQGLMEYSFGYHLLFELAKCLRRIKERPYLFGSILRLIGYIWALVRRKDRVVSKNIVSYLHKEQLHRLLELIKGKT